MRSLFVAAFSAVLALPSLAEEKGDLAAKLPEAKVPLERAITASKASGTPVSAKYEVEDGKLQLSVYTMKDGGFTEVVADPKTGAVKEAEKIKGADDLKAATSQKAATAKAKVPLLTATENAVKTNTGSRAVSVYPQLQNDRPVAEVTLLQGTTTKKVTEKLD